MNNERYQRVHSSEVHLDDDVYEVYNDQHLYHDDNNNNHDDDERIENKPKSPHRNKNNNDQQHQSSSTTKITKRGVGRISPKFHKISTFDDLNDFPSTDQQQQKNASQVDPTSPTTSRNDNDNDALNKSQPSSPQQWKATDDSYDFLDDDDMDDEVDLQKFQLDFTTQAAAAGPLTPPTSRKNTISNILTPPSPLRPQFSPDWNLFFLQGGGYQPPPSSQTHEEDDNENGYHPDMSSSPPSFVTTILYSYCCCLLSVPCLVYQLFRETQQVTRRKRVERLLSLETDFSKLSIGQRLAWQWNIWCNLYDSGLTLFVVLVLLFLTLCWALNASPWIIWSGLVACILRCAVKPTHWYCVERHLVKRRKQTMDLYDELNQVGVELHVQEYDHPTKHHHRQQQPYEDDVVVEFSTLDSDSWHSDGVVVGRMNDHSHHSGASAPTGSKRLNASTSFSSSPSLDTHLHNKTNRQRIHASSSPPRSISPMRRHYTDNHRDDDDDDSDSDENVLV